MVDRVGQQLGNYRLVRLLGQGGFAEVYLGEHVHLNTQAAIKVLHTQLAASDIERFRQEARTIAHLEHPHIIRVLDFGVEGATPYLVMNFAPSGTLRDRHPRGQQVPLDLMLGYVRQLADALQYAHSQRFIHRDIKPENMLLGRHGEVLLSDFGIALVAQSSRYQSTKDMAGSVAYMAPEQIEAHPQPASDQYSLGIVVYEWLSGDRPFHGTFTEIALKHSLTPPPSLREKIPLLSPEIEQVIMIALAKDPRKRFASIQAFARALEQAYQSRQQDEQVGISTYIPLAHQPSPSLPKTKVRTPSKPPALKLSRRTLLLAGAGVLTVGTGLLWYTSSHNIFSPPVGTTLRAYTSHTTAVNSVAWAPDGKRIASSGGAVLVWDVATGGTIFGYHGDAVDSAAWSPKGTRIASASPNKIVQVWNAADGGNVFTYHGHSDWVYAVAWSPDGTRIASGSADGTVQVWDATIDHSLFTLRDTSTNTDTHGQVVAVAWSPDGTRIASVEGAGPEDGVHVWNVADGSNAFTYTAGVAPTYTYLGGFPKASVAWSPDGKRIASSGYSADTNYTVQVWDAANGGNAFIYHGHTAPVTSVAWSPDGTRIASGSEDKTVRIWDASTQGSALLTYNGHRGAVNSVAWSPDGTRIASGSEDKTVHIWQAM